MQIDGDGQHDPRELPKLIEPIVQGVTDMTVGTRFAGTRATDRRSRGGIDRRVCLARQPARAATGDRYDLRLPRGESQGILLASDYPHDYPEVETTVWVFRHKLRMQEVPVEMRTRSSGRSSDHALPIDLLRDKGLARALHRAFPPLFDSWGVMTA